MTSSNASNDLLAALHHVQATLPLLTGKNLKDAQAIVTRLLALIAAIGG